MKISLTTLMLAAGIGVMTLPAFAAEAHDGRHKMPDGTTMDNHDHAMTATAKLEKAAVVNASNKVMAKVNGLVCDFCVQSIQKTLMKEPGVTEAHVDLTAKTVTVGLKDGAKLEKARLGELLQEAGYDMVSYSAGKAE